jgi:hypothetical protein
MAMTGRRRGLVAAALVLAAGAAAAAAWAASPDEGAGCDGDEEIVFVFEPAE